ncbi:unnamed protein product, partial [Adineta steineri]
FHLSSCWYESKDSSIQRLVNRISTHPLLGIQDYKIQDAILFPAAAYLELVTTACQQLLSSKENDQQPTIIFEDVNFIKALILNEHELVEIFIQIIMPMCQWYIYSRPWSAAGPGCMRLSGMSCIDIIDSFRNQDNLNKYSLNQFTLHTQVLLPSIETTFLPVRIQKFIYSSKTKTKMNQSRNVEVKKEDIVLIYGHFQWIIKSKKQYLHLKVLLFNKFKVYSLVDGEWKKTIYDKLNLTTDLPNIDHKTYLDTIIKDYCMKRVSIDSPIIKDISHLLPSPNQILNNQQLNSISNQDLIESIEPFNELAAYYPQMAIKDLDLNQQHHPLLNICHSLTSTLLSEQIVTWHSIQLRFIRLFQRFPHLKPFIIILNKYG